MTPEQLLDLVHQVVIVLLVLGSFWVILAPTSQQDNVAAFGLLGAIVGYLVGKRT